MLATNVLALGAVADFGTQNCQYTTKVDARQNVQLTTEPAFLQNRCYKLPFCLSWCCALGQTCSFASFGLCVGLCGLQMCMAAKGWLICALSLSYRYSFVIQINLETDKRVSDCCNV